MTTLEEGVFGSGQVAREKVKGEKGESESPPSSSVVFLFCDFTILVQCLKRCRVT